MTRFKRALPAAVLVAGLVAAPLAWSETAETAPPADMTQGQPAPVNEGDIEKFVAAYPEVQQVRQEFLQQVESAGSREQVQELHQQAQEQMAEAVESNGMSVDDFNNVIIAMEHDEDLRDTIIARLQMQ